MVAIKQLLDNYDGNTYDFCFEILERFDDQAEIFQYVCLNFDSREKNKTIHISQHFTEEEIEECKMIYGDTVDGLLFSNIKKCNLGIIEPEAFYSTLWASICRVFSTIKERAFAFYYIIIDSNIPYQYLGKPLSMSNERYRELVDANSKHIDKVKYIRNSNYSQRTEKASLLLNCLEEIEDFESKTVVLSQAIQILAPKSNPSIRPDLARVSSSEIDHLIKEIDKKIAELETTEE